MNLYEVLGVAKDATADAIKAAWRKASSAAHPDREGGDAAAQQHINKAYEVLGDPEKRAQYDATGRADQPEQDSMTVQALRTLTELAALAMANVEPDHADVLAWMRQQVKDGRGVLAGKVKEEQKKADRYASTIKRLKRKASAQGEDYMVGVLTAAKEQVEGVVKAHTATNEMLGLCLKIMAEYSYEGVAAVKTPQIINSHGSPFGGFFTR